MQLSELATHIIEKRKCIKIQKIGGAAYSFEFLKSIIFSHSRVTEMEERYSSSYFSLIKAESTSHQQRQNFKLPKHENFDKFFPTLSNFISKYGVRKFDDHKDFAPNFF